MVTSKETQAGGALTPSDLLTDSLDVPKERLMGIVYPNFPTVDRPREPIHIDDPLAEELLPGGSTLCAYRLALADHCIALTYQDRDRYADSEYILIPLDGLRQAIAVLQRSLALLEGGE